MGPLEFSSASEAATLDDFFISRIFSDEHDNEPWIPALAGIICGQHASSKRELDRRLLHPPSWLWPAAP
jgi:hypothetical protein